MNSEYLKSYLKKAHLLALCFLAAEIPACAAVAAYYGTGWALVAVIGVAIIAGPLLSMLLNPSGKTTSFAIGIASQFFSALLIHSGRGIIEFHFMVFVSMGLLIVLGDWMVVAAAAVAISAHHLLFFYILPESVFNYNAVLGTVFLHAVFVMLEAVPAGFIAWKFGRFIRAQGVVTESLQSISSRVLSHARQLSDGCLFLADRAGGQAASLEETSSALEEISAMTKKNAENAKKATGFTTLTHKSAEAGSIGTRELGRFMGGIRHTSNEMREAMQRIQAASSNVSKIIKTIDEIAFQTNILALNAAVEAARAGEAGMGFAVVADEVRNLAQRSAQAARETSLMIETSIHTSQEGLKVAEKVNVSIEDVAAKTTELDKLLHEILEHTRAVDEQVAQIAVASDEQARGIAQVASAISRSFRGTEESSSTVQENATSAGELTRQADRLNQVVVTINTIVEGGRADTAAATPACEPEPEQLNRKRVPGESRAEKAARSLQANVNN